jgi:hypothetical protein
MRAHPANVLRRTRCSAFRWVLPIDTARSCAQHRILRVIEYDDDMRWCVLAVCAFVTARAAAREPEFGARGQTVITTNATANVSWTRYDSGAIFASANLGPSFDYFVAKNFSLGADANAGFNLTHGYDAFGMINQTTVVSTNLTVRAAANIRFDRFVSWWLRFDAEVAWYQATAAAGPSTAQTGVELTLFAPLLLHLRSHFFVGFGPAIAHAFSTPANALGKEGTTLSLHSIVGGAFGGDAERERSRNVKPVQWRRFGDEQVIAISGDADVAHTWYQNTPNDFTTLAASAAADYFVFDHVSVGLGVSTSYARTTGNDLATSNTFVDEEWSVAIAPRVGFEIPLTSHFSLYPVASLGVGLTGQTISESGSVNAATSVEVFLSGSVPVLYHVAPHFFFGFGPLISYTLVNQDLMYQTQNHAFSVGAALTVGGWLMAKKPRAS